MEQNTNTAITLILSWEGAEVNQSPSEPGGISKYGVSLQTYKQYYPTADANTIANLTANQAGDFYTQHFLPNIRFNDLPTGIDVRMADIAINLGCAGASESLQLALMQWPVAQTLSNTVIQLASEANSAAVITALSSSWITKHYNDANGWITFGHGWSNRNSAVTLQCLNMVK